MSDAIMVDIERFGDNALTQIGAIRFNPEGHGHDAESDIFHINVITDSWSMDYETVAWWMQQSVEARTALFEPKPVTAYSALKEFAIWCGRKPFDEMWAGPASYDLRLLRQDYQQFSEDGINCAVARPGESTEQQIALAVPWRYSQERCTTTLFRSAPSKIWEFVPDQYAKLKHIAWVDATVQSLSVQRAIKEGFAR